MDDELTPEQKFAAENPEVTVPRDLMRGRSHESIVADLVRLDWSRSEAEALIERAKGDLLSFFGSPDTRRELVRDARRQFTAGLLIVAVGAFIASFQLLLFLSVNICSMFAGVTLGAGGAVLVSRGWTRWKLYGRDRLPFEQPAASIVFPACKGDTRNEPPGLSRWAFVPRDPPG